MAVVNDYSTGTITGISVNKVTVTQPANSATLTIADGKTLTVSNSITIAGTDSSTLTIGSGGTILYDAASSCPNVKPSLILDFANSKVLDPRIDFTRSSTAAYTNAQGLVAYAANNQPRFDHDPVTQQCKGFLIEESRTNLLTYSENFDNAAWTKQNVTLSSNILMAPDGTMTGAMITDSTTDASPNLILQPVASTPPNTYTCSIYVKQGSYTKFTFNCYTTGETEVNDTFQFNGNSLTLLGGSAQTTWSYVGNGWFRLMQTLTTTTTGTFNHRIWTGDRGIQSTTGTLYIWGAQMEVGAFATSYIPTLGSFTSRSSTATYYGSNGLIQTASANTARINYNPANLTIPGKILLEPAATNLLTYSEQFDNANWGKSNATVTANATTAPDGTTTADKLVDNTTNGGHFIYESRTGSNEIVTFSVYVKAAENTKLGMYLSNFTNYVAGVSFDLLSGTVSNTSTDNADYINTKGNISNVGNGWFRCSITTNKLSINTVNNPQISLSDSTGAVNYTGTGTSGIYIWGAQLETGTSATSYIPTTSTTASRSADVSSSAAATRGADLASITGTNFSSWYRQDEGSLVMVADSENTASVAAEQFLFALSDSTAANSLRATRVWASNRFYGLVNSNAQFDLSGGTFTTNQSFVANAYKLNDIASSFNGATVSTDTSALIPTISQINIGGWIGSGYLNGRIANLTYYPKRLSNTELQALSTQ